MTSSSSVSSENAAKKKKKHSKEKKAKKVKKKEKKAEKRAKEAEKIAEYTEAWQYDRAESVKLIRQLLTLDSGIADELKPVFELVDKGDVVKIDGLENKQAKKKMRHLLQALRLAPAEGQGFRSASKNVSFRTLFKDCLHDARRVAAPASTTAQGPAASVGVAPVAAAGPSATPSDAQGMGCSGGDDSRLPEGSEGGTTAADAPLPVKVRKVGPLLPMPGIGPGAEDAGSDEEPGPEEKAAGPQVEGVEREGVDLDTMPKVSAREEWMTTPHESIAGAFSDIGPAVRKDKYEVKRSKEDEEKFEKMFKERGPSLLQEKMDNKFVGHEGDMDRARKRKSGVADLWGMPEREQERNETTGAIFSSAPRKAFDPEQDLVVRKPISKADFGTLVENSVSGLAGRFSRG
eukprot:CAMPEP_0115669254 /NCGR_PEP_ID=MMETSP0272-20121206/50901_1 /TAXON_ID=71861 /ORGANISM="Scrippsiella trochoidea, Strain CCMP3099" /LENGTH=403 /DNA_ID=CAMNT_0003107907 /DNA_START=24 /DNA_END=1232 /DNA_ORIENTATION=+